MKYGAIQEGLAAYQNAAGGSQEGADITKAGGISATTTGGTPVNMKKKVCIAIGAILMGAVLLAPNNKSAATSSSLISGTPPSSSTTASDRAILSKLYDDTNGDSWRVNYGWKDADTPVCDWAGVTCNSFSDVETLRLSKSLEIPQTSYNMF